MFFAALVPLCFYLGRRKRFFGKYKSHPWEKKEYLEAKKKALENAEEQMRAAIVPPQFHAPYQSP